MFIKVNGYKGMMSIEYLYITRAHFLYQAVKCIEQCSYNRRTFLFYFSHKTYLD